MVLGSLASWAAKPGWVPGCPGKLKKLSRAVPAASSASWGPSSVKASSEERED